MVRAVPEPLPQITLYPVPAEAIFPEPAPMVTLEFKAYEFAPTATDPFDRHVAWYPTAVDVPIATPVLHVARLPIAVF